MYNTVRYSKWIVLLESSHHLHLMMQVYSSHKEGKSYVPFSDSQSRKQNLSVCINNCQTKKPYIIIDHVFLLKVSVVHSSLAHFWDMNLTSILLLQMPQPNCQLTYLLQNSTADLASNFKQWFTTDGLSNFVTIFQFACFGKVFLDSNSNFMISLPIIAALSILLFELISMVRLLSTILL